MTNLIQRVINKITQQNEGIIPHHVLDNDTEIVNVFTEETHYIMYDKNCDEFAILERLTNGYQIKAYASTNEFEIICNIWNSLDLGVQFFEVSEHPFLIRTDCEVEAFEDNFITDFVGVLESVL